MGKYGYKIKNYEAGSIYEYNIGVRDYYESNDAMLTNSLFKDFLDENGLNVYKESSTRDIICVEFNYGSASYKEQLNKMQKKIKEIKNNSKKSESEKEEDEKKIHYAIDKINSRKDLFEKKSKQELREIFYENGIDIEYKSFSKNKPSEIIHYKMLYRTPGKAKKGSCMFIREELYDKSIDFLRMGIELPEKNAPVVEIGAYSSLVTSTIVGKVEIDPKNILILNDVDSFMETNVVSVELNDEKKCVLNKIDKYKLKNTLFDGQALIDTSIFPEWGDGYILLRHHFCKVAAFHSNIQLFFKDYYGERYETETVKDMFGNDHFVKDIKLITTDNGVKWLKFNISYDYWCEKVNQNGNMFGIVKTAHESKLGNVQRMSYQMVNALNANTMENVTEKSRNYINLLKKDNKVFIEYLKKNVNFCNDFDVLVALCEQDEEFVYSEYFRERKKKIINSYIKDFENGRVIQNADNLVIVGSPYAMLLHSVGEDVENDSTFTTEDVAIQCFTQRFDDGEYLAEFRSPFNSRNNLGYLHNVYSDEMFKYFNFGKQIIAVNMINTCFQDRNNGSDMDSDSIYTTNQNDIVEWAKYCCENYPTIVNNIPKEKNIYGNTLLDFANIDNNIAAANMAIGLSSNLAQLALTYSYNFEDEKYLDNVCILSVLAQAAIDNAKRKFDVDLNSEIARIKKDINVCENKYPEFWFNLKRKDRFSKKMTAEQKNNKKRNNLNSYLECPMNYLSKINFEKHRSSVPTKPMSDFFIKFENKLGKKQSKKIEDLIQKYSIDLYNNNIDSGDDKFDAFLMKDKFDELISDIQQINISKNYIGLMSWLIDRAFIITSGAKRQMNRSSSTLNSNRPLLLKTLYKANPEALLKCFSGNLHKDEENA